MNVSTGGPHILFFERDSQLTALLTSEFQLSGYECHAARTAVEVFDTIARFPVRILLVNLAQAAAGRREFWVALDTQRRGRGVQVFTYLCFNLAGYGSRDTDERSQMQQPDIEIDGMLGLMSLVDTIRERVPSLASASVASTQTRLPRMTPPSTPVPTAVPSPTNTSGTAYRTGSIADTPRTATITASIATQPPPVQQSYSEKIRAVLYPTQRPTNVQAPAVQPETIQPLQETERQAPYTYPVQQSASQTRQEVQKAQDSRPTYDQNASVLQRLAYGQPSVERESGLDQLSRMLQERTAPASTEGVSSFNASELPENSYAPSPVQQTSRNIGTQPLRAAPIEDLPTDRAKNGAGVSDSSRRTDGTTRSNYGQYSDNGSTTPQTTPLASISTLRNAPAPSAAPTPPAPAVTKATMPMPAVIPQQTVEKPDVQEQLSAPLAESPQQDEHVELIEPSAPVDHEVLTDDLPAVEQQVEDGEEEQREEESVVSMMTVQQEQISTQGLLEENSSAAAGIAPNNAMLLDIVQSLPYMPSPPPQPAVQTISGRTMRTLGSVLLEGHLVPQNRLEVAQNIQRMLRGVDLNYQLGEILLMFKLLTPDQLLAASLVSYGMISTQQISALGRIRQELHAVGLEYDLESLLILFRMITPEQLREVRTSWQG